MRIITGTARGRNLRTLEGLHTRPTADKVKQAMFNIVQHDIEGRQVLDLFGGSGQLGLEAGSRGAAAVTIVENDRKAQQIVAENIRMCKLEQVCRLVAGDAIGFLGRQKQESFDLIFLDPPYAEVFLENALKKISEIDILSDRGIIICERPEDKALEIELPGLVRGKDYRYGKTWITLFRKAGKEA